MAADLEQLATTLPGLSDGELNCMIAMVGDGPELALSLFAWVEHVCDWGAAPPGWV